MKSLLKTSRILIRPHRLDDTPNLHKAVEDSFDELHRWMPWARTAQSMEATDAYVQFSKSCWNLELPIELPFLIFDVTETHILGCISLHHIDWSVPHFELGYWCNKAYRGKGYITEAVALLTEHAFKELKAERVSICCDVLNTKSANIPRRLGFTLEARLIHHRRLPSGELSDTFVFALTELEKLTF
ncbi:MAG: GNAT family N-acetyltransferase [Chlamydiia bacterium]